MPKRWSKEIELIKYKELKRLYVIENKSIGEISKCLSLAEGTVYERLLRLGIKPNRSKKEGFNNIRNDIAIPQGHSKELSEFLGIMLGDGHISLTQVMVTLGNKELSYVKYVAKIITKLFKVRPKIRTRIMGHRDVYFGSTETVRWLLSEGLVHNKVKSQVKIPEWIFSKSSFIDSFLKGFFDTDGSVYRLKFGVQLAFTNRSLPMLEGVKKCLSINGYHPSRTSLFRVYLTRKPDVKRFFSEVNPANIKHRERFLKFVSD